MQFPSITNIKVINNQIFLGLDMNQTFNPIIVVNSIISVTNQVQNNNF